MNSDPKYGLTIGYYAIGGNISVDTFFENESYVTKIQHPNYNNGIKTVVATYEKNFDAARSGHKEWIKFVSGSSLKENAVVQQHKISDDDSKTCIRFNSMKISIHALLKVLYNYIGDDCIKVTPNLKWPHEMHISLPYRNKNSGNCLYDLNKMEAWGITPKWFAILQEAKAGLQDQHETKDEENASSGQCSST